MTKRNRNKWEERRKRPTNPMAGAEHDEKNDTAGLCG